MANKDKSKAKSGIESKVQKSVDRAVSGKQLDEPFKKGNEQVLPSHELQDGIINREVREDNKAKYPNRGYNFDKHAENIERVVRGGSSLTPEEEERMATMRAQRERQEGADKNAGESKESQEAEKSRQKEGDKAKEDNKSALESSESAMGNLSSEKEKK